MPALPRHWTLETLYVLWLYCMIRCVALFTSPLQDQKDSAVHVNPVHFLGQIEGNQVCADCSQPEVEWASINFGVVLCIKCSGVHRSLGQLAHVPSYPILSYPTLSFSLKTRQILFRLSILSFYPILPIPS